MRRNQGPLGSPPSHHLPEAVPVEGDHNHGGPDQVPTRAEGEVPALPGDVQQMPAGREKVRVSLSPACSPCPGPDSRSPT